MPTTKVHPHRLHRGRRLLRRSDFDAVFAQPSLRVTVPPLWAAARPAGENSARLGLVVGKKVLRRAVDRNRAKRAIRESFRLTQGLPPVDIVVRVIEPSVDVGEGLAPRTARRRRRRALRKVKPCRVTVADADRLFRVLQGRLAQRRGARLGN